MKNVNQMTITDSATLKLSKDQFGTSFTDTCIRFFKSAFMLPTDKSLGMRIASCRDAIYSVTVFTERKYMGPDRLLTKIQTVFPAK